MSQRDPKSILIAVEGIDGTGKSSAVPVIEEICQRCGYDTLTTREPYTQEVIDLVHSSQKGNLCEAMIRDRVQHLHDVILPHLSKSKSVVITDRYFYSNVAYNADEVPPEKILEEHRERGIPDADILVLLDMPVRVAQQRIMKTRGFLDPIEKRSMTQARKLFRSMANKHPCAVIVDASKPLEIVHEELLQKMVRVLRVRKIESELEDLEDSMFPCKLIYTETRKQKRDTPYCVSLRRVQAGRSSHPPTSPLDRITQTLNLQKVPCVLQPKGPLQVIPRYRPC